MSSNPWSASLSTGNYKFGRIQEEIYKRGDEIIPDNKEMEEIFMKLEKSIENFAEIHRNEAKNVEMESVLELNEYLDLNVIEKRRNQVNMVRETLENTRNFNIQTPKKTDSPIIELKVRIDQKEELRNILNLLSHPLSNSKISILPLKEIQNHIKGLEKLHNKVNSIQKLNKKIENLR